MADLESMSRLDLIKLCADLDRAISTAGERDRRKALQAAENAVREHGFTLAEIAQRASKGGRGAKPARSNRPAHFRNADNPEQTWSERGRRPHWIHEAEAAGHSLDDMRAG